MSDAASPSPQFSPFPSVPRIEAPPKPETANFWLLLGGVALALIGFLFPLACVEEIRDALSCKSTPDELLCSTLKDYAPDANRYVTLIDAFPCQFYYEARSEKGAWERVYVPVGPRVHGEDQARGENIHVVVVSSHIQNVEELTSELNDGNVTGMLTSRGRPRNEFLEEGNPGIELKKCWTLSHNSKPSEPGGWYFAWVVMCVLCAAGVAMVHAATRRPLGPEAWIGLMMTGPLIWLIVGIGVVTRGRRWLSAPVLMLLFLLLGMGVMMAGIVIVQQYLLTESVGSRLGGALLVSLGSALLGYGSYFAAQVLLEPDAPAPTLAGASADAKPQ